MYKIDFNKGGLKAHFIGIGGISMSGLAEILLDKGFKVSGSDRAESDLTRHLETLGAEISCPQKADNIRSDTDFFVYTAAVHPDNPEFAAAMATGKPILKRAELLGQIMDLFKESIAVAGTHGKTTTTSMISQIMLTASMDPTISVGAELPAIKSNVRAGHSPYFIAEACEYTDSFLSLYPKYEVILNIDAEHLDYFKTLDNERKSFNHFISNDKEDGIVFINGSINNLDEITSGRKVVTFGLGEKYDYHPEDIRFEKGCGSFIPVAFGEKLGRVSLSVPGEHNISNALAAIAVTRCLNVPYEKIVSGLKIFGGAERRFEYIGKTKSGCTVIDDYAHHPTEIKATLKAALNFPHNRLIVCFQPHTYTRTKAFLSDFADALSLADIIVLADIYAAREKDIYGVSSDDIRKLLVLKNKTCYYFHTFDEIVDFLKKNCMNNDLLITMGAGNVTEIGPRVISQ